MEKYTAVDMSSDTENTAFLNTGFQKQETERRRNYVWLTLFNLFLFMLSSLSLMCAVMSQKTSSTHAAAKLYDDFGIFSPAMHVVEYEHVEFETPMPLNTSKYVGTGPSVEDAWKDIAYLPDQMVSMDDFPALQKPADSLKVTDPKSGETGYRVGLEVFHQLHCLNLLRMASYPEYYKGQNWSDLAEDPAKVRVHLDHCIEALRVNLMCLSDINVFTFHEKPGKEGYWPDYDTPHVCRNFDAIKGWARENGMPDKDV